MSSEKNSTREIILHAAWKLLESGEGSAVRMSDIAKAAGVSRQAVYLHFPGRAELLVETTRFIDRVKNVDARLAASRAATNGTDRLELFMDAWCGYIPEIYGVSTALRAIMANDGEAEAAWWDRMNAVRHGCEAAVNAIHVDGLLQSGLDKKAATDLLWALLSIENWERLTLVCGWEQEAYVSEMKRIAKATIVTGSR